MCLDTYVCMYVGMCIHKLHVPTEMTKSHVEKLKEFKKSAALIRCHIRHVWHKMNLKNVRTRKKHKVKGN